MDTLGPNDAGRLPKMKVFIGWSGETSHKVAIALHDWLPKVIQAIKPFVSSEDIARGARWSGVIALELQASDFGIICATRDNIDTPWINFEAGALSKEIEKSSVTPFLFDLKPSEVLGPLGQFMAVPNEKDEISKLLTNINERQDPAQRLEKTMLHDAFRVYWPQLEEKLKAIAEGSKIPSPPKRMPEEVLEELLESVRLQQRYLELAQSSNRDRVDDIASHLIKRIESLAARLDAISRSVESLHKQNVIPPVSDAFPGVGAPSRKTSGSAGSFSGAQIEELERQIEQILAQSQKPTAEPDEIKK
jgi:hypothetical protein